MNKSEIRISKYEINSNYKKLMTKPDGRKCENMKGGSCAGMFWFAGWLFTIGYANLVWWKIILGIIVWPFFLGDALR